MSGISPTLTLKVQADYASLAALKATLKELQAMAGGAKVLNDEQALATRASLDDGVRTAQAHQNKMELMAVRHNAKLSKIEADGVNDRSAYTQKVMLRTAEMTAKGQEKAWKADSVFNAKRESENKADLLKRFQIGNEYGAKELARQVADENKALALAVAANAKRELENKAHLVKLAEQDIAYGQMSLAQQVNTQRQIAASRVNTGLGQAYVQNKFAPAAIADTRPIAQMEAALKAQGVAAHGAADGHNKLNGMMREGHSLARGMAGPLGAMWLTWGSLLPLLAGATLSAGISKAITTGAEFEMVLARIQGVSGETKKAVAAAGQEFKGMAENSALGSKEIAAGAQILVQAGLDLESAVKALPTVLQLATVGELDMARAAEIATGTMNAFGLSVEQIPGIANVLSKAADISQTNIGEMGQAMQQASTIAQEYQVSLVDMSAGISSLAQVNIRGSAAGTAYKNMLNNLVAPSKKGAEELAKLGVSAFDAQGKIKDMPGTFTELAKALSKMTDAEKANAVHSIFTERGAKGALNYMRALNDGTIERFTKDLRAVAETADYLEKKQALLNETVGVQGKMAFNALGVALIGAFESSQTGLLELTKQLKEFVQSAEFKQGLRDLVSGFVSLANAVLNNLTLLRNLGSAWLLLKVTSWVTPIAAVTAAAYAAGGGMMAIRAGLLAVQGALLPFSIAFLAASALWFVFKDNANKALDEVDKRTKKSIDLLDQVKRMSYVATQGDREATGSTLDAAKSNMTKAQADYQKALTALKPKKEGDATWDNKVANNKNYKRASEALALAGRDYETAKEANQEVTDKLFKQQKESEASAANLSESLKTTGSSTENTNYKAPDEGGAKAAQKAAATAAQKELNEARKYGLELLQEQIDNEMLLANEVGAAFAKSLDDKAKAQVQYSDSLLKSLESTQSLTQSEQDRADSLQRQIDVFGLSEQAVSSLETAKLLDAAATYEQNIANKVWVDSEKETLNWGYAQIEMLKDRAAALKQFGVKTTELDALKEAKKFTEDFVKSTSDGFRKIYDSITTGGGNVFKNLKQSAKAFFFDWLYNMTLKKWVINIATSISSGSSGSLLSSALSQVTGGAGAAGGGGALGSATSLLNVGKSIYSAFSGALSSNVGALVSTFAPKLGSAIAGQMLGSAAGLGPTVAGAATGIGSLTGGVGALGSAISTALPYIGLAIGAFSLIKSLSKKNSYQNGNFNSSYQDGALTQTGATTNSRGALATGALPAINELTETFATRLGTLFKTFGLSDKQKFSTNIKFGKQLQASFTSNSVAGGGAAVDNWSTNLGSDKEAGMAKFIANVLGDGLQQAIATSSLSAGIKGLFKGLTDQAQIVNMINATRELKNAQADLGTSLGLTVDNAAQAAKATGLLGDSLVAYIKKITATANGLKDPFVALLDTKGAFLTAIATTMLSSQNTEDSRSLSANRARLGETQAALAPTQAYLGVVEANYLDLSDNRNTSEKFRIMGIVSAELDRVRGIIGSLTSEIASTANTIAGLETKILNATIATAKLPTSLEEFDAQMRGINKSTAEGINNFNILFSLRDDFAAFTKVMDSLKGNLKSVVYELSTPAEQLAMKQSDLVASFAKLGVAVPASKSAFLALAKGVDINTLAGLKMADALPNLFTAYIDAQAGVEAQLEKTTSGFDALVNSLNSVSTDKFVSMVDYMSYQSLGRNYGKDFADARYLTSANDSAYTPTYQPPPAQMNQQVQNSSTQATNSALIAEVKFMRERLEAALIKIEQNTHDEQAVLAKWDLTGMPKVRAA